MPRERVLEKIDEAARAADDAYAAGRVVIAMSPGFTWGGNVDENLGLLIEAVEKQGWKMEIFAFDTAGMPHIVFRRHDEWRSLR